VVASFSSFGPAAATTGYFEKDGYDAPDDPDHRQASFWYARRAAEPLANQMARDDTSVAFLPAQKCLIGAFARPCGSRRAGYIPVGCLDGMQEG